jgi:hypothetical protein
MIEASRIAAIKQRTRLSALVGERVSLKRTGRGEWAARCPFHKEKTPSFTVSDPKGFYHCFGCGAHGDAISWVTKTTSADTFLEAVEYLAARCGPGGNAEINTKPLHQAPAKASDQQDADRRRRAAQRLFLSARPLADGDPVWKYLRGRGIDIGRLSRLPRALRYHPNCWNGESRQELPAMVAAVIAGDGSFRAVHRTYLDISPSGAVRKAALDNAKLLLASVAGGAIRLSRGASGRPWRRASSDEEVVAAEGIEDGLAAALMMPDRRVIAAISLGNLRHLVLPAGVTRLLVCEQNDPFGSGAKRQLAGIVAELRDRGVEIRLLRPPVFVKDLAEYRHRPRLARAA